MSRHIQKQKHSKLVAFHKAQDGVVTRAGLAALGWHHDHGAMPSLPGAGLFGNHAVVLHADQLNRWRRWWSRLSTLANVQHWRERAQSKSKALTGFESEAVHVLVHRDVWVPRVVIRVLLSTRPLPGA